MVTSKIDTVNMRRSRITMSGFSGVIRMSEGMVPPPGASLPGKSAKTWKRFLSTLIALRLAK